MRPSDNKETLILDRPREIRAVCIGIELAGLKEPAGLHDKADYLVFPTIPMAGNAAYAGLYKARLGKLDVPNFHITCGNEGLVRAALEATIATKGLQGSIYKITGAKRAANKIIASLDATTPPCL